MKSLRLFLVGILLCISARAAHVSWTYQSSDTTPQGLRSAALYPSGTFTNGAGVIITRDRVSKSTDANGQLVISNVYGGVYYSVLQGTFTMTTNWYRFPVTNGLINAADWITAPTNVAGTGTAYTTAQSDARFVQTNDARAIVLQNSLTANSVNVQSLTSTSGEIDLYDNAGNKKIFLNGQTGYGSFQNISLPNFPSSRPIGVESGTVIPFTAGPNINFNADTIGLNTQPQFDASGLTNLTGSGIGITNVQSLIGFPQSVNMNNLTRFWTNLQSGGSPIKIVSITDILGFPGGRTFIDSFTGLSGFGGSAGFGYNEGPGDPGETASANVLSYVDYASFPINRALTVITNNQTYTFYRRSNGTGITDTNWYADTIVFNYLQDVNGGTFDIQTNGGSGWATIKTVSTVSAFTNSYFTNISIATPTYVSLRALGITGTNRIIGGGLYYSKTNSFVYSEVGIQSHSFRELMNAPANTYSNVFKGFDGSFIMLLDTDGAWSSSDWANFNSIFTNYCPNSDVLLIGNRETFVPAQGPGWNISARTNALAYGLAFWDAYFYWGTNLPMLVKSGMLGGDNVHPTTVGVNYLDSRLWNDLFMNTTLFNGGHVNAIFQGSEANLFNNARTNRLGIGTASPNARFTVVDISNGSSDAVSIESLANTEPMISIGQLSAPIANRFRLHAGGNPTQFSSIEWPSGGYLLFKIANASIAGYLPSGGAFVGSSGADAGAGGLWVDGKIYGNGSTITNAVTTQSANYNILNTDSKILLNGNLTATLPTAVGIPGKSFTIICKTAGTNGILTTASQTIMGPGVTGATKWTNSVVGRSTKLTSDGANWFIEKTDN